MVGRIFFCSCLTFLPGPAWVLLSKICRPFPGSLYKTHLPLQLTIYELLPGVASPQVKRPGLGNILRPPCHKFSPIPAAEPDGQKCRLSENVVPYISASFWSSRPCHSVCCEWQPLIGCSSREAPLNSARNANLSPQNRVVAIVAVPWLYEQSDQMYRVTRRNQFGEFPRLWAVIAAIYCKAGQIDYNRI